MAPPDAAPLPAPARLRRLRVFYGVDVPTRVASLAVNAVGLGTMAFLMLRHFHDLAAAMRQQLPPQFAKAPSFILGAAASAVAFYAFCYTYTLLATLHTSLVLRARVARDLTALVRDWSGVRAVLDVGCGRGVLLATLALRLEKEGAGGRAVGFDAWRRPVSVWGSSGATTGATAGVASIARSCSDGSGSNSGEGGGGGDTGVAGGEGDGEAAGSGNGEARQHRTLERRPGKEARPVAAAKRAAAVGAAAKATSAAARASTVVYTPRHDSGSMARTLRRTAAEGVGDIVTCKCGSFRALPFKDAYFDAAFSSLSLHTLAPPLESVTGGSPDSRLSSPATTTTTTTTTTAITDSAQRSSRRSEGSSRSGSRSSSSRDVIDSCDDAGRRERRLALFEMARVVKPRGHVVIWDVLYGDEYGDFFREMKWRDVRVVDGPLAFLLPSKVVIAQKP